MHFTKALRLITALLLSIATSFNANATDNASIPKTLWSLINSAVSFAERMPRKRCMSILITQDISKVTKYYFNAMLLTDQEKLYYKTKKPLFVINYATTYKRDSLNYTLLDPENIKSIFISEDPGIILKFADPEFTLFSLPYSCAVFIETVSDPKDPTSKGTRRQTVEGYTIPEEFLNIDDPALLDDPDFRRTLYWNPMLITGSDGKARIEFLNNSTCRNFQISIHGIDNDGTVYSY